MNYREDITHNNQFNIDNPSVFKRFGFLTRKNIDLFATGMKPEASFVLPSNILEMPLSELVESNLIQLEEVENPVSREDAEAAVRATLFDKHKQE